MLKLHKDHPHKDGRTCTTCGTFKPADEFYWTKDKRSLGGVAMRSKCKSCDEKRKYKRFIQKQYNIDYEKYQTLLEKQNGKCAICESKIGSSRTSRLFIDHYHTTGNVRGLLCSACNHALGLFKDSPKLLHKAIKYLSSTN